MRTQIITIYMSWLYLMSNIAFKQNLLKANKHLNQSFIELEYCDFFQFFFFIGIYAE